MSMSKVWRKYCVSSSFHWCQLRLFRSLNLRQCTFGNLKGDHKDFWKSVFSLTLPLFSPPYTSGDFWPLKRPKRNLFKRFIGPSPNFQLASELRLYNITLIQLSIHTELLTLLSQANMDDLYCSDANKTALFTENNLILKIQWLKYV